jgi:aspartyl-tRNA(Asn)/glutamyl-tRNA(Gln) amidotransferase subunit B
MTQTTETLTPIIGLEIHVELDTRTKMFCRCPNHFGDEPNTHTCPVCIGMPGALPVMNAQAVEFSMRAGLALNCSIPGFTKWDRKSYYYPDLPKNYQISQYDLPLSINGMIEIPLSGGATKKIRIRRAHLEEDAGKNVHDFPAHTGVDLNRAGVPLLEIVSEPDLRTVEEVMSYARSMQRLVRWLGVSQANMQMGHMRFEPNISIWVGDPEKPLDLSAGWCTPIFEIKNLNSFRALEKTTEWVIGYHRAQIAQRGTGWSDAQVGKQNWGYRDDLEACEFQRGKEEAHDYRYFPDPDLVPVEVDDAWRARVAATIGELPIARKARYIAGYKLTDKEADALTQDAPTGDLLDAAVAAGAEPKRCANLLLGRGSAIANERGCAIAEIGLTIVQFVELAKMLAEGKVNATIAAGLFDKMIATGQMPMALAQTDGVLAVSDAGAISAWVDQAIAANPQAVADIAAGGKNRQKAFGFLTGQIMKLSKGAAAPAEVTRLLQEKLETKS